MAAARGTGGQGPVHRLRPVVWGSLAVVTTYAGFQLFVADSATGSLWWRNEWLRRNLQARFPTVSFGPPQPFPPWQSWLPSAVTAVGLVGALVVLALALVCAGRGWWLLLVSALPLLPANVAPGVWAPALSDQVMYAVVRSPGATGGSSGWSWLSAGVEALVIAVPAVALAAVVVDRRPALFSAAVVRQLLPVAAALAAVAAWNWRAGEPQDWVQLAHRVVWMLVGALLLAGGLRRRWALLSLAALPALAAGLLRWTGGIDGQPQVVMDPAAAAASAAALVGGGWVVVWPWAVRVLRSPLERWHAMVVSDAECRVALRRACAPAAPTRRRDDPVVSAGPALLGRRERSAASVQPVAPVRHRAPSTPAGAGGRHRG